MLSEVNQKAARIVLTPVEMQAGKALQPIV